MIEYKIGKKPVASINTQLKDMSGVLKEVTVTYKILLETISEHGEAFSSPSIDAFRRELQQLIDNTVKASQTITDNTEKLVIVSDQASKHLAAFEQHFSAALQKHSQKTSA